MGANPASATLWKENSMQQVVITGQLPIEVIILQNPKAFFVSQEPIMVDRRFGKKKKK